MIDPTEAAQERAKEWIIYYLTDRQHLEYDLWGNCIEAELDEHPSREEVFALVSQVRQALVTGSPLPAMDSDLRRAFCQYMERGERIFADAAVASWQEDFGGDFVEEVMDAYQAAVARLKEQK